MIFSEKHWKTTFEPDRSPFSAFLRAELGLDTAVDFESKSCFWESRRMKSHVIQPIIAIDAASYGESIASDKFNDC